MVELTVKLRHKCFLNVFLFCNMRVINGA